jgi:ABC-type branched-subunit amino acid transport system substrate-binding protein
MRYRGLSVVAVMATLAIAGCGSSDDGGSTSSTGGGGGGGEQAAVTGTVKIAFIGDLTGPAAPDQGVPQLQGAKAAIAYLKSSGEGAPGVTYKLVTRDSHSDTNVAASSARELTQDDDVVAILGGGSTEQEQAMQGTINRAKVLNFTSVEGEPFIDQLGTDKQYPWVFQVSETPQQVVEPLVDYLTSGGEKKIAQIYSDISYGQTQSKITDDYAKSEGIEVATESVPITATDFTAQLEKLKGSGATSLMIWSFGPAVAQMMTELKQIGWAPKIAGPLGTANTTVTEAMTPDVAETAAAGPVPMTLLGDPSQKLEQPTLGFYEGYSKEAKTDEVNGRTVVGMYGFDTIMLINAAIKGANSTDPEKLRDYLDSGESIRGARGTYVYGPSKRAGVLPTDAYGVIATATPCSGGDKCKGLS